jgi:hypothetical protein
MYGSSSSEQKVKLATLLLTAHAGSQLMCKRGGSTPWSLTCQQPVLLAKMQQPLCQNLAVMRQKEAQLPSTHTYGLLPQVKPLAAHRLNHKGCCTPAANLHISSRSSPAALAKLLQLAAAAHTAWHIQMIDGERALQTPTLFIAPYI